MTEIVSSTAKGGCSYESSERASLKCHQCRKDRKRCLTDGLLNSPAHKKCDRCVSLHHKCGPRSKAKMTGRSEATALRGMTANEIIFDISTLPSGGSGGMFCHHALQRILLRSRCENAALSARVPHDTAFLRSANFMEEVVSSLNLKYRKLSAQQHSLFDPTRHGDIPSSLPILSFDMHLLQHQHMRFTSDMTQEQDENTDSTFWTKLQNLYTSSLEHELLVCTQGVLDGIDLSNLRLKHSGKGTIGINIEIYRKVQAEIQIVLDAIFMQNASAEDGVSSEGTNLQYKQPFFPAAVLAYYNCDPEAAFKITTEASGLDLPANAFNQNILHLAVISRDLGFLKRLKDFDSHAFAKAAVLGNGYTAIDLSTILDDVDIFNLLLGRCYNTLPQTAHLLHLAIIAKSSDIVDAILDSGRIVLPPYTAVAELAIELGVEDLAIKFLPWLQLPWTTEIEKCKLLDMAQTKVMTVMTERLSNQIPPIYTAQSALDSLQQQLDFLADDDLTDMSLMLQEGNSMLFMDPEYLGYT